MHKMNQFGCCRVMATAALGIAMAGSSADHMTAYESNQIPAEDHGSMATGSKFFCNIKALAPADRAHHKQLTDKLISSRTEIVEIGQRI